MKTRLLVGLLMMAAGCGGTSADKACSDLAAARCNKRQTCSNGASINRTYGDMNTCLMREKQQCLSALAAKGTGNSPDHAEQCVTAMAGESCDDWFNGNPPAACVNTGTLADSTGCAFPGQCSSTYCNGDKNAACGTCGTAPAAGADCTTSLCARGLTCDTTPGTMGMAMTCVAEGSAGAMCSRAQPCAAGFTCIGATATAMGTCTASATMVGAACDATFRTGTGCAGDLGLWCNAMTSQCTAIAFAGPGQPCGEGTDGNLTDCSGGGQCVGSTFGRTPVLGTCKAPAADGAACDTAAGPPCLAPAKCVTAASSTAGTCALADATKC